MPNHGDYEEPGPTRDEIDATAGAVVLDFGANGCGFCHAARLLIEDTLDGVAGVQHIKVADGPGRPLGRSFRVKLWPTLVFLKDGKEVSRVVRPTDAAAVRAGLEGISSASA